MLKPSGVKLREEVRRATAEKGIERVSGRRQHDAHNDPLLFLPKAIPDIHLLVLSSGPYSLRDYENPALFKPSIIPFGDLAVSNFASVLDVGQVHHAIDICVL